MLYRGVNQDWELYKCFDSREEVSESEDELQFGVHADVGLDHEGTAGVLWLAFTWDLNLSAVDCRQFGLIPSRSEIAFYEFEGRRFSMSGQAVVHGEAMRRPSRIRTMRRTICRTRSRSEPRRQSRQSLHRKRLWTCWRRARSASSRQTAWRTCCATAACTLDRTINTIT